MTFQESAFLVEVSLESLTPTGIISTSGQLGHAATLRGRSALQDLCFIETVYVLGESLRNMERLKKHGSVVIALSERWKYEHDAKGGWFQHLLDEVVRVVSSLPQNGADEESMHHGFDQLLADQILRALNRIYPAALQSPMDLKHQLGNEPDDRALLTALDALLGEGLINGKTLRDHATGERRLAMLADIQISRQGRQLLEPVASQPHPAAIIHGDQFINYGSLGAAGRNSSGIVVVSHSWSQNEALSALDSLLAELQKFQTQTPDLAKAQREFHKVRDEIADEASPDQSAITKWLFRGKQLLATAALSYEVIEAAHTVYKLFGM